MNIEPLKNVFKTIFPEQEPKEFQEHSLFIRYLVSRFSSGNVNLQLGRFSTKTTIEKRREQICNYHFID